MNNNDEFVSVKEACDVLGCGRTKIYTYYISNGFLQVRRKIGNKSFFYRSEIEALRQSENNLTDDSQNTISAPNTNNKTTKNIVPSYTHKSSVTRADNADITTIHPVRNTEEQEIIVTDYIKNLKNRIIELEEGLDEAIKQKEVFAAKLLNTIPLLDFNAKIKEKESLLLEYTEKLHKTDLELKELGAKFTDSEEEKEILKENFEQSLELAVTYKSQFDKTEQKQQQLNALHKKLIELQTELDSCRFFEWQKKGELKNKIKNLIIALSKFE